MKIIEYFPDLGTFKFSYPEEYVILETELFISITSEETGASLTLSEWSAQTAVTAEVVARFLEIFTTEYEPLSDIKAIAEPHEFMYERPCMKDDVHWHWWMIGDSGRLLAVSANSNEALTERDRSVFVNIIDSIVFYPDED